MGAYILANISCLLPGMVWLQYDTPQMYLFEYGAIKAKLCPLCRAMLHVPKVAATKLHTSTIANVTRI